MIALATGRYTEEEVRRALHAAQGTRFVSYRYERLDANKIPLGTFDAVEGSVRLDSEAQLQRTAQFSFRFDESVNWQAEYVRPVFCLRMPDGGNAEWPLGVFLMPTVARTGARHVFCDVEAYDTTLLLWDSQITKRHFIAKGTRYTAALSAVFSSVGVHDAIIEPSDALTQTALEWEAGTSRGQIAQELLTAAGYEPLSADAWGRWVCRKSKDPRARWAEYRYIADEASVLLPEVTAEEDIFRLPNVFTGIVSRPDRAPMSFTFEITDPKSPLAAVNRGGRRVSEVTVYDDAASAQVLEGLVRKRAQEATQVFSKLTFSTAPMPHHAARDVYWVEIGRESGKYQETRWEMALSSDAEMQHEAQKEVLL